MDKNIKLVTLIVVLTIITTFSIASVAFANDDDVLGSKYSPGPAPSAGDSESEGPEWSISPEGDGRGPAPYSGLGINDGPGW